MEFLVGNSDKSKSFVKFVRISEPWRNFKVPFLV